MILVWTSCHGGDSERCGTEYAVDSRMVRTGEISAFDELLQSIPARIMRSVRSRVEDLIMDYSDAKMGKKRAFVPEETIMNVPCFIPHRSSLEPFDTRSHIVISARV